MIKGLPRDSFVSDQVFDAELGPVMSQHWIAAGTVADLDAANQDGSAFLKAKVADQSLVVIRDSQGKISAFHNVCRHRGTRLVNDHSGALKNDCVTCPYHAWSYDCSGTLIGAPNMNDVSDFDRREFGLFGVACHVWAGIIFVHLANPQADFRRDMHPLISRLENWNVDELKMVKTLSYDVSANWKLIFQNYSECYHCPTVHPDLNQQTPYKSATNDLLEGPILGGPMQLADGFDTISSDGKAVGPVIGSLDDVQRHSIYYYTVFPNMFVSAHPDYVMIHQLTPLATGKTKVFCHFLAGNQASVDSLSRAWQMWDTVNQQDWQVCELTQLGVNSPAFQPGPYSNLESMLAAFDCHYRNVMQIDRLN